MLGAATDADAPPAHRPRFKTLIGVPRSSPEIDELAGLGPSQVRATPSGFEPPLPPPLAAAARPFAGTGASAAPSATGAAAEDRTRAPEQPPARAEVPSWPWGPAPAAAAFRPRNSPVVESGGGALADSAVDVSAEVAALRSVGSRRRSALTLLAAAGIVGVLAWTAPRERTLALRWLREAYASRTQSAAQALLPLPPVSEPPVVEPRPSSSGSDITTGEPLTAQPTSDNGTVPSRPSSTEPAAAGVAPTEAAPEEMKAEHPSAVNGGAADPNPSAAPSAVVLSAKATPQVARASVASGSRTRPVAATRKRSPRAAALALGRTKPRSTRQNSSRKDGGSGIIRQTPF